MNFSRVAGRLLLTKGNIDKRYLRRAVSTFPHRAAAVGATVLRPEPGDSFFAQPIQHQLPATHAPSHSAVMHEFWRKVPIWKDVPAEDFLSNDWNKRNIVAGEKKLAEFLEHVLPDEVPFDEATVLGQTRRELIGDVLAGMTAASMAVQVMPYVLSRIDWQNPRADPVFNQFIPLKTRMIPDHPKVTDDSLEEKADEKAPGLVHRYPDKVLFLATSVCPTYCTYCTRAYKIGPPTDALQKDPARPGARRWEKCFAYIESNPEVHDVVVSGGDAYYLSPEQIRLIGERLLGIPHIKRIRIATKALAVAPARFLDESDGWVDSLIGVSDLARSLGKSMALHTHFNHAKEISWVTRKACLKLTQAGVLVRNQTVLLRGVNDSVGAMGELIRSLADNNVIPYYVYQCDMVRKVEHRRTPLQTILELEAQLRGTIAGFMMPQFIVDLPEGGGKRLANSYHSYDRSTGRATFTAPAVTGRDKANKTYEYWDPLDSLLQLRTT